MPAPWVIMLHIRRFVSDACCFDVASPPLLIGQFEPLVRPASLLRRLAGPAPDAWCRDFGISGDLFLDLMSEYAKPKWLMLTRIRRVENGVCGMECTNS